jgi:hypothetical protein
MVLALRYEDGGISVASWAKSRGSAATRARQQRSMDTFG